MIDLITNFDVSLFTLINIHGRNAPMDVIFPVLSNFGYFKIPTIVICLLVLYKGTPRFRKNVLIVVLSVLFSDFLASKALKPLFERIRPCHALAYAHILGRCSGSFSFPSSHAVNISAFAFAMSSFYPRWKIVLWALAVSVCYSRVYLGMHYPLDCFAGALLGVLFSHFSIKFLSPLIERLKISKLKD